MKVSGKSNNDFSASCTACKAHRRACGFSSTIHESYLLATSHSRTNCFGKFHFAWRRCTVRRAICCCLLNCRSNRRMCMAKNNCAVALHKIDVLLTFNIPNVGTISARNNVRRTTYRLKRTYGTIHPTRNDIT